jgi:hypothetical protein
MAGQWCTPVNPATWGSLNRRIVVQAGLSIKQDHISKISNAKEKGWWSGSSGDMPS